MGKTRARQKHTVWTYVSRSPQRTRNLTIAHAVQRARRLRSGSVAQEPHPVAGDSETKRARVARLLTASHFQRVAGNCPWHDKKLTIDLREQRSDIRAQERSRGERKKTSSKRTGHDNDSSNATSRGREPQKVATRITIAPVINSESLRESAAESIQHPGSRTFARYRATHRGHAIARHKGERRTRGEKRREAVYADSLD